MRSLDKKQFVAQFTGPGRRTGVVDTNLLSPELRSAFQSAGVPLSEVRKAAGADGQLKGSEFGALFKVIDAFEAPKANGRLSLGDASARSATGALNDALKAEVAANQKLAQYQPGSTTAAPQRRKTLADALVVAPKDRKPPVSLAVTGKDQFAWGRERGLSAQQSNHVCFNAAEFQTTEFVKATRGNKAPQLNPKDQAIQAAYAEDASGRVVLEPLQQELAHDSIDRMLDQGLPVMVGVSLMKLGINHDKLTDHFVTIYARGSDASGRQYYDFKDPGLNGRSERFYVDAKTDTLFRVAEPQQKGERRNVSHLDYELTQVRTWRGID